MTVRIVCLSDTHCRFREIAVPDGDLLVHAGDATVDGTRDEILDFADWLRSLPHPRKVVVAGNHDHGLEDDPDLLGEGIDHLLDRGVVACGLRVYGSPWRVVAPERFRNPKDKRKRGAFMIDDTWAALPFGEIPADVDVLVTHHPPSGVLDERVGDGKRLGSTALLEAVQRVRPRLHVFEHVHDGRGVAPGTPTVFVNAAMLDEERRLRVDASGAVVAPIVVDLPWTAGGSVV